jgi:hypothetical protein
MHCWTWPNLLFWSIIPEHAPRHSFPLFPGFAGLAAFVWIAWLTGRLPWPAWLPVRVRPGRVLVGVLVLWLVAKVVWVEVRIPQRNRDRDPLAKGQLLASLVPQGQTLYLFRLKDEGIMFYYGRSVLRLPGPELLPSSGEPVYCIVGQREWQQWASRHPIEVVQHLRDEQGDPIVLLRVHPLASASGSCPGDGGNP